MTNRNPEVTQAFQTHAALSKHDAATAASRVLLVLSMAAPGEPRTAVKSRRRWMNDSNRFRVHLERAAQLARD